MTAEIIKNVRRLMVVGGEHEEDEMAKRFSDVGNRILRDLWRSDAVIARKRVI